MHNYRLAAVIALAGVGMLISAALISHNRPAPSATPKSGRGGSVWGSHYFPNVPLVTHEGETVHFFDDVIKDKVVALNFVYTSCPDSCPMETARLLEVSKILGDRVGRDVFFYSITIDPENDTQPVLQEFAKNWNIPDSWKFLTGKKEHITLIRQKFGLSIEDVKSRDFGDHDLSLVIGNQSTGRWMKRSPFENSYVLANQLGSWLHGWKFASEARRDYAEAPELRSITAGEDLFRTRCSSCHTIGGGDVLAVAERRVGPDLLNVTQYRDRAWLERWMAEPDKMLAAEDPLAMELFEKYNNVSMPNFRLTATDVADLLQYIEDESQRIGKVRAHQMSSHQAHEGHAGHGEESPLAQHGKPEGHGAHDHHAEPTGEL